MIEARKFRLEPRAATTTAAVAKRGGFVGTLILAAKVAAVTWVQCRCKAHKGSLESAWLLVKLLSILHLPPLRELQRAGHLPRWTCHLSAPFEPLAEPVLWLTVATIALDVTGGRRLERQEASRQLPEAVLDPDTPPCVRPGDVTRDALQSGTEETSRTPEQSSSLFESAEVHDEEDARVLQALRAHLAENDVALPDRLGNDDELRRFWKSAASAPARCLRRLQSSAQWRRDFVFLPSAELKQQRWDRLVFWHGRDAGGRPILIVRLGLATESLPWEQRHAFVRAVVSQVEHGILHLLGPGPEGGIEAGRVAVLVDCRGCRAWKLPLGLARDAALLLQRHYPVRLARGHAVNVPPIVGFVANAVLQVVGETTRRKVRVDSSPAASAQAVAELIGAPERVPPFLGGGCACEHCSAGCGGPAAEHPRGTPSSETGYPLPARPCSEEATPAAAPLSVSGDGCRDMREARTPGHVALRGDPSVDAAGLLGAGRDSSAAQNESAKAVELSAAETMSPTTGSASRTLRRRLPLLEVRAHAQEEFTRRVAPHVRGPGLLLIPMGTTGLVCLGGAAQRRSSGAKDVAPSDGAESSSPIFGGEFHTPVVLHSVRSVSKRATKDQGEERSESTHIRRKRAGVKDRTGARLLRVDLPQNKVQSWAALGVSIAFFCSLLIVYAVFVFGAIDDG